MIRPHDPATHGDYPAVIAVAGNVPADEGRQIGELLRFLKRHEVIAEYSQAALLLRCVPSGGSRRRPGPSPGGDVITIHQPKGREWDVAITGSLDFDPPERRPGGSVAAALLWARLIRAGRPHRRL